MFLNISRNCQLNKLVFKKAILRNIPATANLKYSTTTSVEEVKEWRPIYKLPIMGTLSAFSKIKIYQLGLTVIAAPSSFALEYLGILPTGVGVVVTALGVTGSMTLFGLSLLSRNLIGFIYLNPTNTKIKISYLDYWGKRQNIELTTEDVIPSPSTRYSFASRIQTKSRNGKSYTLLRKFGYIIEGEWFDYYFGE